MLDTSAVLDIATGDSIYGQALLAISNQLGATLAVPIVTFSAAWQSSTTPTRPWLDLMISEDAEPSVVIVPVDVARARGAGLLAADAGHPDTPQGAVHAAHLALERQWPVVTKAPDTLLALSTEVRTETIP